MRYHVTAELEDGEVHYVRSVEWGIHRTIDSICYTARRREAETFDLHLAHTVTAWITINRRTANIAPAEAQ